MTAPATRFPLSVLLTSLPLDFPAAVETTARLGFTHVDVVALVDRPDAHREALAEAGVLVACASLGRDLPEGVSLDALSVTSRRTAVELAKRQINDAAQLGATTAYLIPPSDDRGACLTAFAEVCCLLADHAASRMMKVCLEPIPGRFVSDSAQALAFLDEAGHSNLGLLLDVGHCQISGEESAEVVRRAGSRLTYVHLDDNDGQNDLHWPLLRGRLTEATLIALGQALRECGYTGAVALELKPDYADALAALQESKEIAERLLLS